MQQRHKNTKFHKGFAITNLLLVNSLIFPRQIEASNTISAKMPGQAVAKVDCLL